VIELARVVQDLRSELEAAIVQGDGAALRFEIGPVELEVVVGVEQSANSGGRVRFLVAEIGSDGKVQSTSTQRIKLVLQPKLAATGAPLEIAGDARHNER